MKPPTILLTLLAVASFIVSDSVEPPHAGLKVPPFAGKDGGLGSAGEGMKESPMTHPDIVRDACGPWHSGLSLVVTGRWFLGHLTPPRPGPTISVLLT